MYLFTFIYELDDSFKLLNAFIAVERKTCYCTGSIIGIANGSAATALDDRGVAQENRAIFQGRTCLASGIMVIADTELGGSRLSLDDS